MSQATKGLFTGMEVAVGTAVANSTEIAFEEYIRGFVFIPPTSAIVQLNWLVAERLDAAAQSISATKNSVTGLSQNYMVPINPDGSAVTQAVSPGKAYPIPAILAGAAALKIIGNAAGVVIVCLKS